MKPIVVLLILVCLCQGRKMQTKSKSPRGNGCPIGWFRFRDTDRCFYISTTEVDWNSAKASCESMNSQLAPSLTCEEQFDLKEMLTEYLKKFQKRTCGDFWIGMYRFTATGNRPTLTTTKNVTIAKNSHCLHWAKDNPFEFTDNRGSCVAMEFDEKRSKGEWKNLNCHNPLRYVCIACPNNFDYFPEIDECLYLNTKKMNWNDARMACTQIKWQTQLLTVKNSVKQAIVAEYLKSKYQKPEYAKCFDEKLATLGSPVGLWIGGQTKHATVCGTPYVWKPIGAPELPIEYFNWNSGNPNCGSNAENCIGIVKPGFNDRWDDIVCSEELCSVCEF